LNVKPDTSKSSISLPKYLGCGDIDTIKIVTIEVTSKEVSIYLHIYLENSEYLFYLYTSYYNIRWKFSN
jgi:hypothetical protein